MINFEKVNQERCKLNYDIWNLEKQKLNNLEYVEKYPKPREIWFTKMWINIWDEQNWKEKFQRPVLILKKIWSLYFCISLTTKYKENFFYKKLNKVTFYEQYKVKESIIVISQAKVYDKKRFIKQIWYLENNEFIKIKKILKNIYF